MKKGDDETYFSRFVELANKLEKDLANRNKALEKDAVETVAFARKGLMVGIPLVWIVVIMTVYWLNRAVTRPVADAVTLAESVCNGDLSKVTVHRDRPRVDQEDTRARRKSIADRVWSV